MKKLAPIFLLILLAASCKKEQDDQPGTIIYTDIYPDVTVSYNYIQDKTYYLLDVDQDSVADFSFSANRIEVILPFGTDWGYTVECNGENSNQVTLPNQHPSKPDSFYLFSAGAEFDSTYRRWRQTAYLLFNIPYGGYYRCLSDTSKYLGLMIRKAGKPYFGWVKLDWNNYTLKLKLKSCALRTKAGKPLRTGEYLSDYR